MKDYLITIFEKLHLVTGLRQVENQGVEKIGLVIDEIIKVCNRYSKIPDTTKKAVIDKMLIEDRELKSLTARQVNIWLGDYWRNLDPAKKFNLLKEDSEEQKGQPVSDEKAKEYLKEWKKSLSNIVEPQVKKPSERMSISKEPQRQSVKMEFIQVPCPGHIDNTLKASNPENNGRMDSRLPCIAPDPTCFGCQGLGVVKKIKH